MSGTDTAREQITQFGAKYDYDVGYLTEMLDTSPGAFDVFQAAQGMAHFRDVLPLDAHFAARIAAMRAEDCGACAQLNLRMAGEEGVERELLRRMVEAPDSLPQPLADVWRHAEGVCLRRDPDREGVARIQAHYGDAALAEIAVVVAGCRMFPTAKRTLLRDGVCEILRVDF